MADNSIDFRLRIIDEASRTLQDVRRSATSSMQSMSADQQRYTNAIFNTRQEELRLRAEQVNASRARQREINQEISALRQRQRVEQEGLRNANRQQSGGLRGTIASGIRDAGGSLIEMSGISKFAGVAGIAAGVGMLGKAYYDLYNEIQPVYTLISKTFNETGTSLELLSQKVLVTSKTFGADYTEVVRAANVLSKQFGISGKEAIDLVNQGFEKGANVNGDYLEQLREYSIQFKDIGLSASQAVAIFAQTEQMGVFNDKAPDTIKEANLRLKDLTKAQSAALKPLEDKVELEIRSLSNQGKTMQAMKLLSGELNKTYLSANEVQAIVSNIFGGAGEDVGMEFIKALKDINLNLADLPNKMSDAEKATQSLQTGWTKFTTAIISSDSAIGKFINNTKTKLGELLTWIAEKTDPEGTAKGRQSEEDDKFVAQRKKVYAVLTNEQRKQNIATLIAQKKEVTNADIEAAKVTDETGKAARLKIENNRKIDLEIKALSDLNKEQKDAKKNESADKKNKADKKAKKDLADAAADDKKDKDKEKKKLDNINEFAGASVKSITLNVQKLVGIENLTSNNLKESETQLETAVMKILQKAILDVSLASAFEK